MIGDGAILGVGEEETEQAQRAVFMHSGLVTIGEKSVIPPNGKNW